jgi:hypothetical protein
VDSKEDQGFLAQARPSPIQHARDRHLDAAYQRTSTPHRHLNYPVSRSGGQSNSIIISGRGPNSIIVSYVLSHRSSTLLGTLRRR